MIDIYILYVIYNIYISFIYFYINKGGGKKTCALIHYINIYIMPHISIIYFYKFIKNSPPPKVTPRALARVSPEVGGRVIDIYILYVIYNIYISFLDFYINKGGGQPRRGLPGEQMYYLYLINNPFYLYYIIFP